MHFLTNDFFDSTYHLNAVNTFGCYTAFSPIGHDIKKMNCGGLIYLTIFTNIMKE
jgi:hypothetical protein